MLVEIVLVSCLTSYEMTIVTGEEGGDEGEATRVLEDFLVIGFCHIIGIVFIEWKYSAPIRFL